MNRLHRSPDDRVFAGVAGGMAETYDLDPALVRIGWAFLILVTGGLFLLLYIVMAIVVPLRPGQPTLWSAYGQPGQVPPPGPDGGPGGLGGPISGSGSMPTPPPPPPYRYARDHDHRGGSGALVLGIILIFVGGYFLFRQFLPALDFDLIWPLIVIGGGALLIVAAFNRPRSAA